MKSNKSSKDLAFDKERAKYRHEISTLQREIKENLRYIELLKGVPEKKWFHCGEFKVMGFYVPHDDTPNFGFLIEHEEMGRLLYMTDLEYCPYSFRNLRV